MIELNTIYNLPCLEMLIKLPDNSIDCCVTSPPYYGLRDYGVEGQLGLEATPEEYVMKMVQIFSRVKRVLKDDGTLWLNLGDSYAGSGQGRNGDGSVGKVGNKQRTNTGSLIDKQNEKENDSINVLHNRKPVFSGGVNNIIDSDSKKLKPKDLIGIPWMVAFALRADGWYLRQDIIWHKPNPMPESVTDRCTKAHEYIFLMSKSARYYYDADAIKEPLADINRTNFQSGSRPHGKNKDRNDNDLSERSKDVVYEDRNKRSVWTVTTKPFSEAHFATFPEDLIVPMIKAGCPEGGTVLDPFMGAGTTALVAYKLNRNYIGSELNPDYCKIAEKRILPHKMQQKLF